jgi:hypothetical protein
VDTTRAVLGLVAVHVILGLLMVRWSPLATLHAALAVGGGLLLAARSSQPALFASYAAAYVAGSEVLWRIAGAKIFWETGKYAVAAILLVALWRLPAASLPPLMLLYLAMLLPGAVVTLTSLDLMDARGRLSFNLSGPFALAIAAAFFSNVRLTPLQLRSLLLLLIAPLTAVAVVGVVATLTASDIRFTGESNAVTSGGFGPNQVSSVLGLGVLATLLWLFLRRGAGLLGACQLGLLLLLIAQCAMTFSRGGLYAASGAAAAGLFFLMRHAPVRRTAVRYLPLVVLGFFFLLVPKLEEFTGGALGSRFADTNLSHRDELVRADIRIFMENPFFGAGPGVVRSQRGSLAHTEFTRLLSEHGIFGLVALCILLGVTAGRLLRARGNVQKGVSAALLAWTFLYMASNGMRVAAPSLTFGLAMATLIPPVNPWADSLRRRT